MTEVFAMVGAVATITVAMAILVSVASVLVASIKEWLVARRGIVSTTKHLAEVQTRLMAANNELNRRLSALESEVHGDD